MQLAGFKAKGRLWSMAGWHHKLFIMKHVQQIERGGVRLDNVVVDDKGVVIQIAYSVDRLILEQSG